MCLSKIILTDSNLFFYLYAFLGNPQLLIITPFLITYCIEMGYAKYYDIPFSVIQIDGRNVCYNFIKIMLIFICIYGIEAFLSNIFSPLFKKYKIRIY